jgi:hypothetical protein
MAERLLSLVLVVALLGCGAERPLPLEAQQRPVETEGAISVLDSGWWRPMKGCSAWCVWEEWFWVDLAVRNDAYQKEVGVVWTTDGWATQTTTLASYEGELGAEYERWGVDVDLGTFSSPNPGPAEIDYAVYVVMNGVKTWDPYNNHYIHHAVSAEEPVTLVDSGVRYEAGTGAVLEGRIRVFDLAFDKEVFVRWSLDGWETWQETVASWVEDDDWEFAVEGLGLDALPEGVDFAVRYHVQGVDHWDNNDGQDFHHQLAPEINPSYAPLYFSYDLDVPVSGVLGLGASYTSQMPVASTGVRLDGGPWKDGLFLSFSTWDLTDGPHQLEYRLILEGGYEVTAALPFDVDNALEPLGRWEPAYKEYGEDEPRGAAWGMAVADDGAVYVKWDEGFSWPETPFQGIARFDAYGDDDSLIFHAPLAPAEGEAWPPDYWQIAVDDQGRVYGLEHGGGKALYRWTAQGALDASFGDGGRLDLLEAAGPDHAFDVGMHMIWGDGHLWLSTRVWAPAGSEILRLTEAGELTGSLPLADGPLHYDADGLWVLHAGAVHNILWSGDALIVDHSVLFEGDLELHSPAALTRTGDGRFWALDSLHEQLLVIGAGGAELARWYGGGGSPQDDHLGAIDLGRNLAVLPGGDVVVLDTEGAGLVRFSGTLLD